MKKIILALFALFVLTAIPFCALATFTVPTAEPLPAAPATLGQNDVLASVDNITNWFFAALLIVAVWFLILAAFHFVTAGGDIEKVNTARNEVMYAMIGVLIGVLAKGIVGLAMGFAKPSGG
jgi:hypothetical protein